jgi:hypothetical protein
MTCTLTVSLPPAMNIVTGEPVVTCRRLTVSPVAAPMYSTAVPETEHRDVGIAAFTPQASGFEEAIERHVQVRRVHRAPIDLEIIVARRWRRALRSCQCRRRRSASWGCCSGLENTRTKSLPSPAFTTMRLTLAKGKLLTIGFSGSMPGR